VPNALDDGRYAGGSFQQCKQLAPIDSPTWVRTTCGERHKFDVATGSCGEPNASEAKGCSNLCDCY